MTKTQNTTFTCDKCGKSIVVESNKGYPYDQGWFYLYKLEFKEPPTGKTRTQFDKHYCSKECIVSFMKGVLE